MARDPHVQVVHQVHDELSRQGLSVTGLAKRMKSTRGHVQKMLSVQDKEHYGRMTMAGLKHVARALGCEVQITLVPKALPVHEQVAGS